MHHSTALSNRTTITESLKKVIHSEAIRKALEVASGTGAHLELFGKLKLE